jgi:phage tail-like protein
MPTRIDPYLAKNFRVEIDNITAISFTEVLGLEALITVVDYRTGDSTVNSVSKLAGMGRYSNITLKRGFTQDTSLWEWMHNNLVGVVDRRNMSVVLQDSQNNDVLRWNLVNAWPCRWAGPELSAECSAVAIETVEICYESFALSGA